MQIKLSDRWAIAGKSGSGKTVISTTIASMLVPYNASRWEVWILDSKNSEEDDELWHAWGYGEGEDRPYKARRLIHLNPFAPHDHAELIAQYLLAQAMDRKRTNRKPRKILLYNEYKHVCKNSQRAGTFTEGIHLRGRGLGIGMMVETQELAFVPRQSFSQANHVIFASLSYPADIKRAREICPIYEIPDKYGFFYGWLDSPGPTRWQYYSNIKEFVEKNFSHRIMQST